jgi:hypothetical protein
MLDAIERDVEEWERAIRKKKKMEKKKIISDNLITMNLDRSKVNPVQTPIRRYFNTLHHYPIVSYLFITQIHIKNSIYQYPSPLFCLLHRFSSSTINDRKKKTLG